MNTVAISSDWRDARWRADYAAALKELTAPPTRLLLPLPPARPTFKPSRVLTPFSVPVIDNPSDPDSRADVLSRIRILKTPKPGLRVVLFDGAMVGKIAQSPYGPGWLADCTRSRMFWSMDDAALALVEAVLP